MIFHDFHLTHISTVVPRIMFKAFFPTLFHLFSSEMTFADISVKGKKIFWRFIPWKYFPIKFHGCAVYKILKNICCSQALKSLNFLENIRSIQTQLCREHKLVTIVLFKRSLFTPAAPFNQHIFSINKLPFNWSDFEN